MADEQKTFSVKNISVRLIHLGATPIAPEETVNVFDDEAGINRRDAEGCEFLKIVDSEVKAEAKTAAKKTPTGAGWNSGT